MKSLKSIGLNVSAESLDLFLKSVIGHPEGSAVEG